MKTLREIFPNGMFTENSPEVFKRFKELLVNDEKEEDETKYYGYNLCGLDGDCSLSLHQYGHEDYGKNSAYLTNEEFFAITIDDTDPQCVINDIKGRLDLDHLTDDELVEHLCGTHGKEWDGVEPLRVGHIVKHDKYVITISLMDKKFVVGLIDGEIWTIHIDNLQPVKPKAKHLVEEYLNACKEASEFNMDDYTQWLIDHDKLQS